MEEGFHTGSAGAPLAGVFYSYVCGHGATFGQAFCGTKVTFSGASSWVHTLRVKVQASRLMAHLWKSMHLIDTQWS